MRKLQVFLLVIVSLIAVVFGLFAWYGGFSKIEISVEQQGGETIVYEEITGDYSQSAAVMDEIFYSLKDNENINTTRGFGIFYDNPQKVETDKLRSEAGCIIEESDLAALYLLEGKYNVSQLPEKEYIVCSFPFKGKMSVMVSLFRVYPALNKYARENGLNEDGAVIEIYDVPGKRIYYRKEI